MPLNRGGLTIRTKSPQDRFSFCCPRCNTKVYNSPLVVMKHDPLLKSKELI